MVITHLVYEGFDGLAAVLMGGILHTVGDDGHDNGGVLHILGLLVEVVNTLAHGIVERCSAAGLVVLGCEILDLLHGNTVIDILHRAGAEGKQADIMLLCVGELLLCRADASDGLVETGNGCFGNGGHRAALIEDDEIEYLGFDDSFHICEILG